ncbi:MAG: hypothetical protein HZA50_07520 [Planctomycetes bacterium]|nr:hypothetical protein [Planctomycetota bacterium]
MSEAMTVETIVEAYWQMKEFWTKVRYPLQTPKGGWSDIDILAYNPKTRELVIAESKVQGRKKDVYAYTKQIDGDILKFGGNYFDFLRHLKSVCKDGVIFSDFQKMVKKLIVQLVGNYVISDDVKPEAEKTVWNKIRKDIPTYVELKIRLETTLDVISQIITLEYELKQGKRYGHPVLDIARELNRYMHPQILYAGKDTEPIKKAFAKKLKQALMLE